MRSLLIFLVIGCAGAQAPIASPPVTAPATADELVDVIGVGAQPKVTLRYRFVAGQTELMDFEMTSATTMTFDDPTLGNRTQHTDVPALRTRIKMDVASLDPNGDAHARFSYLSTKVAPEAKIDAAMRQTLDDAMQQFVGVHGSMTLTPRGTSRDVDIQFPDAMTPAMRDSINQTMEAMKRMYIAFPRDPVGIGAQWEIRAQLPVMGATVQTLYRYTLVEATATWVKLSVVMLQTAERQPIENGAMKGNLVKLTTKGRGIASIPFSKLAPTAKIDSSTEMAFTIGDHDEMRVSATMQLGIQIRPAR